MKLSAGETGNPAQSFLSKFTHMSLDYSIDVSSFNQNLFCISELCCGIESVSFAVYLTKHKHPPSEVEKVQVSFAKSAKAFDLTLHSHWLTPTTLFKKEWKMQKIVLFKVNFLDDFSHNDFYFFSNIILFVSVNPSG